MALIDNHMFTPRVGLRGGGYIYGMEVWYRPDMAAYEVGDKYHKELIEDRILHSDSGDNYLRAVAHRCDLARQRHFTEKIHERTSPKKGDVVKVRKPNKLKFSGGSWSFIKELDHMPARAWLQKQTDRWLNGI